jgi:hypothetical protein
MLFILGILVYIIICYLIADKIGRYKKIGFTTTLVVSLLLSPFVGLLLAEGGAQSNPKGCNWCGNQENEAKFCGLCGKDEEGSLRPGFKK